MSWQADAIARFMRAVVRPMMARTKNPQPARARFHRWAALWFRKPPLTLVQEGKAGPVAGVWISNRPRGEGVVLYFHGGAYMIGAPETHAAMLAELARLSGARVFAARYRLAPEHPFPAAFEDALAAFDGLVALGHAPETIVLGGDSAGGGLALALLAHLCGSGRRPAGLLAFSPWTDLTFTGASLVTNARRDQMLPAHRLTETRAYILGGARPGTADDPRLSPLYASFPNPPPVMIHSAESEILRDDSMRMRSRLPGAEIRLAGDLPHVWPILHNYLPEARATLAESADFIRRCLPPPSDES
jgi:epsilon-lactone hydrolase